jgi:hypothetical protein
MTDPPVARASVSVPVPEQPSVQEVAALLGQQRSHEPGVYRSASAGSEPPEPVYPPERPSPPEPASPPRPPEPHRPPVPGPPLPSPFPQPAPVPGPLPPGPVPPGPPPQPIPPVPPEPQPPVPPTPPPPPPVPGPPAADSHARATGFESPRDVAVPASALPVWPPPTTPTATTFQSRASAPVLPAPPPPPAPAPPAVPTNGAAGGTGAAHDAVRPDPVWAPTNPPTASAQYGEWARQQRPQGTVYGGSAPSQDQPAFGPGGTSALEVSGSLTGHLLAQGRPVEVAGEKSTGSRSVIIAMVVVCVMLLFGLSAVVAHLAGVF